MGDGKSTRIYYDAWLLGMAKGKVSSPPSFLSLEAIVDALIDPHMRWWNVQLIDLCFYPPEAQKIKNPSLYVLSHNLIFLSGQKKIWVFTQ